jgi:hypothetical protein
MIKSSNIKWLVIMSVLLLLFFNTSSAQSDSILLQINIEHLDLKKGGMTVLGGWAISNIAVSGLMMTKTKGVNYRFHEMNVFWNVVNLGIAAGAYYGANQADISGLNMFDALDSQKDFSSILLLNAGLDVAYVMSGLYLRERAKNTIKHQHRLKGYGNSIILQGSFLFAFDLVLYGLNENAISSWLETNNLALSIAGSGLSVSYFFN